MYIHSYIYSIYSNESFGVGDNGPHPQFLSFYINFVIGLVDHTIASRWSWKHVTIQLFDMRSLTQHYVHGNTIRGVHQGIQGHVPKGLLKIPQNMAQRTFPCIKVFQVLLEGHVWRTCMTNLYDGPEIGTITSSIFLIV